MADRKRRLFFALWPADAVRSELAAAAESHASLGRVIAARNLHITLVFLGAVAPERVADVQEIAASAQKLTFDGRFSVHLDAVEFWRRSSLICLTAAQTPPQLLRIVERLRAGLRERGFELREHETFRPHVTLVRDVARDASVAGAASVHWPVDAFALVESQVGQRGSEYTVLEAWSLTAAPV
ncbi:MAG TPA: RNA 2',3'-cyclic phosphodiesterase [Steroidobacteraceae bacterium]|nr:RNA 2',3'-cyclic phosphodiesterase [Steroidobacteraceae bacterium]